MRIQKIVSLWLCAVLLLLPLSGCGTEEGVSTTEDGFTTRFDETTGTLTVSGEGVLRGLYPREWVPDDFGGFLKTIEENTTVKKLVLEEGITQIDNCFNDMNALKEVVFPSTLSDIRRSFISCTAMEELTIPENVKIIRDDSFSYCTSLSSLQLKGPKEILHSAFDDLDSLCEVVIPDNSLLCNVFYKCYDLVEVIIGKGVTCHQVFAEMHSTCWGSFAVSEPEEAKKRTFYLPKEQSETLNEGLVIYEWDKRVVLE